MLETKFHRPGEGLQVQDGSIVAGYASIFGERDQGGDIVMPGAYSASLERMKAAGGRVRMLWQHDAAQPIGVWDEVREDTRGLWVKGRLLTEVARGREAAALMDAGAVDGLSIGYRTVRAEKLPGGGRKLLELELWEVSLVTFPMLSLARVAAKGTGEDGEAARMMATLAQGLAAARAALKE
jgi:uncharacterized protein